jgi:Fe2+ or Zn2+ uptake regulation protein
MNESWNEDGIARRLHTAKLRPTQARRQVLEALMDTSEYLRTEDIYRKLIERKAKTNVASVYRALRDMRKAGLLLILWDTSRAIRYHLPPEDTTLSLRIVCRGNGDEVTFSDPELYARILSAAVRHGLSLEGREFELHADFEQQGANKGKRLERKGIQGKGDYPQKALS